ncbi:MAG: archaemetzincin family Zn-dependent metalloprotease [Sulfolobales archaeon]
MGVLETDQRVLRYLESYLKRVFIGSRVSVYRENIYPPKKFYNVLRGQYRADMILEWLRDYREDPSEIIVGIVSADAYVPGLNFVFGLADPVNRIATVYLERLYTRDPSDTIFFSRLEKEVTHEIGHVLGLGHCSDRKCVMSFSNSILDVDFKSNRFCKKCLSILRKNLIEIEVSPSETLYHD